MFNLGDTTAFISMRAALGWVKVRAQDSEVGLGLVLTLGARAGLHYASHLDYEWSSNMNNATV